MTRMKKLAVLVTRAENSLSDRDFIVNRITLISDIVFSLERRQNDVAFFALTSHGVLSTIT